MSAAFLRDRTHPLRDLDQLDVAAREHPAVLIEVRPVRVGLAGDHPSALGQGVQHGPQVELHAVQALPRTDGQVLVVQEQGDAFFLGFHDPQRNRLASARASGTVQTARLLGP